MKWQLTGNISFVFDIQWIHSHYLWQIQLCLDYQYSESVSNKNLALHWRQNSCPGTTLIFFGFQLLSHFESDHLFTFNFPTMYRQYCTTLTFSPLRNITKHLFLMWHMVSFISPLHWKVLFFTNARLPHFFQSHSNS